MNNSTLSEYVVTGTNTGANGIFYGKWVRYVEARTKEEAILESLHIVKSQCLHIATYCGILSCEKRVIN